MVLPLKLTDTTTTTLPDLTGKLLPDDGNEKRAAEVKEPFELTSASDETLSAWAGGEDRVTGEQAAGEISRRIGVGAAAVKERARLAADIQERPFNPREEISADAKFTAEKIVRHIWIVMLVVPLGLMLLYSMASQLIR